MQMHPSARFLAIPKTSTEKPCSVKIQGFFFCAIPPKGVFYCFFNYYAILENIFFYTIVFNNQSGEFRHTLINHSKPHRETENAHNSGRSSHIYRSAGNRVEYFTTLTPRLFLPSDTKTRKERLAFPKIRQEFPDGFPQRCQRNPGGVLCPY